MEQQPLGYNPRTSDVSYAEPPGHARRLDFDQYMDDSNPKRQKYSLKRKLDDMYDGAPPGPTNPKKLMSYEAMKPWLEQHAPGWYHRYYDALVDYPELIFNKHRPFHYRYVKHRRKFRSRYRVWHPIRTEVMRTRRMNNKRYPIRRYSGYKFQSRGKRQPNKFGRSWQYTLS